MVGNSLFQMPHFLWLNLASISMFFGKISCSWNNTIVFFSSCGWANSCFSPSYLRSYGFLSYVMLCCLENKLRSFWQNIKQMIFCQFIPWEKKNVIWQTLMVYCLTLELFNFFRSFIVINSVLSEMVFIYFSQWESRIMYTSFMWLSTFSTISIGPQSISWPTVHCMSQISDFRQFLHTFLSDYLSCQPCIKLIHHKIILFSNTYLSKEEFYASRNRLRQKTSHIIGSDRQVESWPLNQQYITSHLTQFSFCLHGPAALLVKMTHLSCMF